VRDDYYRGDIEYQQQYEKISNNQADMPLKIEHQAGEKILRLRLKDTSLTAISGDVHFFRPSTAKADVHLPLQFDDNGVQEISTDGLLPGLWRVKIDWTANGRGYYTEMDVVL
ncbi:MAG: hypothetical protein D6772_05765, partial [Bacteroidetes bacterium]